jgi:hypothetical protein
VTGRMCEVGSGLSSMLLHSVSAIECL